MGIDYLMILDKLLLKERTVIRESTSYKVYLPNSYKEIWAKLHEERRKVDVIVLLPRSIYYVNKILIMNRHIIRENDRYKIYLPRKYSDLWENLHKSNTKVDLLIVLKH